MMKMINFFCSALTFSVFRSSRGGDFWTRSNKDAAFAVSNSPSLVNCTPKRFVESIQWRDKMMNMGNFFCSALTFSQFFRGSRGGDSSARSNKGIAFVISNCISLVNNIRKRFPESTPMKWEKNAQKFKNSKSIISMENSLVAKTSIFNELI